MRPKSCIHDRIFFKKTFQDSVLLTWPGTYHLMSARESSPAFCDYVSPENFPIWMVIA